MSISDMQTKARRLVLGYVLSHQDATQPPVNIGLADIRLVWFCKTLQNWKALVITDPPDEMYYEVTYDGNREQTYLDVYKKSENVVIKS